MSETPASEATLNEPYGLRGLDLPNRAVLAPMTRISAHGDGRATERMRDYYRSFAEGGFGLLVTEGIYPDTAHSQGYLDQPAWRLTPTQWPGSPSRRPSTSMAARSSRS